MVRRVKFDNSMKEKDEGSTFRRSPSPYPSMSDISDLSSLIDFQDENQEMADLVSDLQPNLLIEYSDDEEEDMIKKSPKVDKSSTKSRANNNEKKSINVIGKKMIKRKQLNSQSKESSKQRSETKTPIKKRKVNTARQTTPKNKVKRNTKTISKNNRDSNQNVNNNINIGEPSTSENKYVHGKEMIYYSEGTPCIIRDGQLIANDKYNRFLSSKIEEIQFLDIPAMSHLYKRRMRKEFDIDTPMQLLNAYLEKSDEKIFIEWIMVGIKMEKVHAHEMFAALRDYAELMEFF